MTNFNDNMTDAMLAILDAAAAQTDSQLDECLDDARTAFFQLTDAEREPLQSSFDRICLLIMTAD